MTRKNPAAFARPHRRLLVGASVWAAVVLASVPAVVYGQGAAGTPAAGVVPGGIPFTPWLTPGIFAAAGFAWSAFGWYTSDSRYNITDAKFKWGRFLKSGAAGVIMGLAAFAMAGPTGVHDITATLLGGTDGLVGPAEIAFACAAAFPLVGGSHTIWTRLRGSGRKTGA